MDESIHPFLLEHKFKVSGKYKFYFRTDGDIVHRIATGFVRERGRDEGWMDVTFGVGFFSLAKFLKPCPLLAEAIDVKDPIVLGARMSTLNPNMKYLAWRVLPDTNPAELGRDIITSIEQYAFPFLSHYGSLESTVRTWEAGISYNLGIQLPYYLSGAYWLSGECEKAIQLMHRRRDHYFEKYSREGKRLDDLTRRKDEEFIEWLIAQPRP